MDSEDQDIKFKEFLFECIEIYTNSTETDNNFKNCSKQNLTFNTFFNNVIGANCYYHKGYPLSSVKHFLFESLLQNKTNYLTDLLKNSVVSNIFSENILYKNNNNILKEVFNYSDPEIEKLILPFKDISVVDFLNCIDEGKSKSSYNSQCDIDANLNRIINTIISTNIEKTIKEVNFYFSNLPKEKNFAVESAIKMIMSSLSFTIKNDENKLNNIINILKSQEMVMNEEAKESEKELKICLLKFANSITDWKINNGSFTRERAVFEKIIENFDLITEDLSYSVYDQFTQIVDTAVKLNLKTDSVNFEKMKQQKHKFETSEALHSWYGFSEGNMNYLKSLPIPSDENYIETEEPFCWNTFIKCFKEKAANNRVWCWIRPTEIMCVLAEKNYNKYKEVLDSINQMSKSKKPSHHIRAIDSYTRCFLNLNVDDKLVRGYRSESKNVSEKSAQGLIRGRDKYEESEFRKLISQFSDCKHPEVLTLFIKSLPKEFLTVFVANPLANKRLLKERMEEV